MAPTNRHEAFPPALSSVRDARHFVRKTVSTYLPGPDLETVELLTSEVVTNAVIHAGSSPIVEVAARGGTVRVSVEDDDPAWPMPQDVAEDATSGRGVGLVDTMADAWGVEHATHRGKRVWFEVRGR